MYPFCPKHIVYKNLSDYQIPVAVTADSHKDHGHNDDDNNIYTFLETEHKPNINL